MNPSRTELEVGFPLTLNYSIGGIPVKVGGTITNISRGKKTTQLILKDGKESFTRHIPNHVLWQSGYK